MSIEEISVSELAALGPDVRLIDVREDVEYKDGHVGHAVNVPMSGVTDRLEEFRSGPVYVICKSGGRSLRVCELATAHGHDVVNVVGGMSAWTASGYDAVGGT